MFPPSTTSNPSLPSSHLDLLAPINEGNIDNDVDELKLFFEEKVDELDLRFVASDIAVASGAFELSDKDKLSFIDLDESFDSNDDEGDDSVDLTASMSSGSYSQSEFKSRYELSPPLTIEFDIYDNTSDDSSIIRPQQQQSTRATAQEPMEEPRLSLHRRLSRRLRRSVNLSLRSFNKTETDETKKRIRNAASRSKVRQQQAQNAVLAKRLKESQARQRDLKLKIHQADTRIQTARSEITSADRNQLLHYSLEGIKARTEAVNSEREVHAQSATDLRQQLRMNDERLEKLRQERNEEREALLHVELMLAHQGLTPSDAEMIVSAHVSLEGEFKHLLSTCSTKNICLDDYEEENDEQDGFNVDVNETDRIAANVKVVEVLSQNFLELQNETNGFHDKVRSLQLTLGKLATIKTKQEQNILTLERTFASLTSDEVKELDRLATKTPSNKKRFVGGLFRSSRRWRQ